MQGQRLPLEAVLGMYKNDLSRLELEAQLPLLKPLSVKSWQKMSRCVMQYSPPVPAVRTSS